MVQTIEQKLTEGLINNGLYKEQATQVMENLKNDEMQEIMKGRWSDTIDNYPQAMINLLWAQAKHKAVEWIDENMPQHWARPVFSGDDLANHNSM